jgi:predicted small secreted protein
VVSPSNVLKEDHMLRSSLLTLVAALALSLAGCNTNKGNGSSVNNADGTVNASADVCQKCAGVQTATSDGRCPMCSAQVDACPKCAGVQKATADGKCPVCKDTAAGTSTNSPTTRPSGT